MTQGTDLAQTSDDVRREYLTNSERVSLYPLNTLVADAAVDFRAVYNLKTPDAIQLAVARVCGADVVVTNDRDWRAVKSMRIVTMTELAGVQEA